MTASKKNWIKGFLKSWTNHAGTYLAAIGYLQTQDKLIDNYLGPDATGLIMMGFGLLIIILRSFKTNESLLVKGQS